MTRRKTLARFKKIFESSQEALIHYLTQEIKFLMAHLGKKPKPTEAEKALLSRAAKAVDPLHLEKAFNLFTPATLYRWHRERCRKKWDYSDRRKKRGRPRIDPELEELVVKLALENPKDGYPSLAGKLSLLGFETNPETIQNILKRNGISPAPERKEWLNWKDFLDMHWDDLAATDFLTWEVLTPWAGANSRGSRLGCTGSMKEPPPYGLVTYYILFFIRHLDRKVHIAGITTNPNETWMLQMARNITDPETGFLKEKMVLLHDRDTKYTAHFSQLLKESGIQPLKLPPQSPNCNAHAERFVRSIKEQCLSRLIITSEKKLRTVLKEYEEFYNNERCHQGLGNRIPCSSEHGQTVDRRGRIKTKQRLGGLLKFYFREEIEPKPRQDNAKTAA